MAVCVLILSDHQFICLAFGPCQLQLLNLSIRSNAVFPANAANAPQTPLRVPSGPCLSSRLSHHKSSVVSVCSRGACASAHPLPPTDLEQIARATYSAWSQCSTGFGDEISAQPSQPQAKPASGQLTPSTLMYYETYRAVRIVHELLQRPKAHFNQPA